MQHVSGAQPQHSCCPINATATWVKLCTQTEHQTNQPLTNVVAQEEEERREQADAAHSDVAGAQEVVAPTHPAVGAQDDCEPWGSRVEAAVKARDSHNRLEASSSCSKQAGHEQLRLAGTALQLPATTTATHCSNSAHLFWRR